MKTIFFHPALLSLFLSILLAPASLAQNSELEILRKDFDVRKGAFNAPIEAFHSRYEKQLLDFKSKVQAKGDLDQILAIDEEIKMIPVGGSKIPEKYAALSRLRSVYDKHIEKLTKERSSKFRSALRKHRGQLLSLQSSLTRDGNIEAALEVKTEITALDTLLGSNLDESFDARLGAAGNSTPGKLIVFGTTSEGDPIGLPDEKQLALPHIRVSAGYDRWMAITADGKLTQPKNTSDYRIPPKGTKDIVDFSSGRHLDFLLTDDGTLIPLGNGDHTKFIPKDLEKGSIASIDNGHSIEGILLKDGTFHAFGYKFFNEHITYPESQRSGITHFAVSAQSYALVKKDGTISHINSRGTTRSEKPEGLDGRKVISVKAGLTSGALFLHDDGKVFSWKSIAPPADLPKAKQIRCGVELCAAQLEDNTWVVWGSNSGLATHLNTKLKELGPLKDLDLGKRFFVAIK